jgi:hypothetical protein
MTKEEILKLLHKKYQECCDVADEAIKKNNHNSQDISTWYRGKAAGIVTAISVIGMLDKPNNKTNIC